ncbi:MAG: DegT/DnrJ/EryC1/StrS family aminotransferase [Deferribacteres bacterium]|nr:DegT/DnrJ/EryC1/StrS family aminotransferase [candidate division KSB1 bacterium]MCB9503252.1 DegT/DnrJ/EryC1/StrS family aminotransferase [Deferribacteres bacterium]
MNQNISKQATVAIQSFFDNPEQWDMSLSGTDAVYRMEQKFSKLIGKSYALAVSNATTGLWAVFQALDLNGAEVITTPYTWCGSLTGLIATGNQPVFVDIDPDSLTIDPEKIVGLITPTTKAILAVDIYGYPCNGPALRKIADEYNLTLIQDCAQSFGAYMNGKHTGCFADLAVFSLGWNKGLFAGEGGVIVTSDEDLYQKLVWSTQHPIRQTRDVFNISVNEFALNLRIHPLAAVWAEKEFDKALNYIEGHRNAYLNVLKTLVDAGLCSNQISDSNIHPSFYKFIINPKSNNFNEIKKLLQIKNLHYRITDTPISAPVYCHDAFKKFAVEHSWPRPNTCSNAEAACNNRVCLQPMAVSH